METPSRVTSTTQNQQQEQEEEQPQQEEEKSLIEMTAHVSIDTDSTVSNSNTSVSSTSTLPSTPPPPIPVPSTPPPPVPHTPPPVPHTPPPVPHTPPPVPHTPPPVPHTPPPTSIIPPSDDLQVIMYRVTKETAFSHYDTGEEFELRRQIFAQCLKLNNPNKFKSLLSCDPNLKDCRATNLDNQAPDGFTPLHAAAKHSNIDAIKILINEFKANTWERDMRGRTPLHIAAENNHDAICRLLRNAMFQQRHIDPIGATAPVDLTGTTPLGSVCSRNRGVVPELAAVLFSPGDSTILPQTPHEKRVGKSPWKSSLSNIKDDLVYAYSEAQGWSRRMEDRLLTVPTITGLKSWSLFAVFDGHGGSYCSQYLADNFGTIFNETAMEIFQQQNGYLLNESPEVLTRVMILSCERAEVALRNLPKLKPMKTGEKYKCYDNSGSTGVICLITSNYIVVGNVGDSRAILALHDKKLNLQINDRDEKENENDNTDSTNVIISSTALTVKPLSFDHKFNIKSEVRRALASGARIQKLQYRPNPMEGFEAIEVVLDDLEMIEDGPYLQGSYEVLTKGNDSKLRMSRSFGDFSFKVNDEFPWNEQAVIAIPDITIHQRTFEDMFIVLACDGIWDVMSNEDVCQFIGSQLGLTGRMTTSFDITTTQVVTACDSLLEETIRRRSQDNLTAILVVFPANISFLSTVPVSSEIIDRIENPMLLLEEATLYAASPVIEITEDHNSNMLLPEIESSPVDSVATDEENSHVSRQLRFSDS